MTYATLFAAANPNQSLHNNVEIDLATGVGAMNLEVERMDVELNSLEVSLAKLAEIESLTTVLQMNGQPKTDAEKLLVKFSTMALFGGEVEFEEITEGYSVESISADTDAFDYSIESFKRRAQSIWAWIKDQIKRIWAVIERFFYNLFGTIPGMRKKAAALRERAAAAQGKVKEENSFEADANTSAALADYDGNPIDSATVIISNLSFGTPLIRDGEQFFYNRLEKLGAGIESAISGASPEDTAYLATINKSVFESEAYQAISEEMLFTKHKMKAKTGNDPRFNGRMVRELGLFAGKTLFQTKSNNMNPATELGVAENVRGTRVELRETSTTIKKPQPSKMNVWELAQCENLADAIDAFCDVAESVQRGAEKGTIFKMKDKLDKTGDKFGKQLETARKRTGDDALEQDALSNARAALGYAKYYGELAAKPLPQIIALYTTGFNAAIGVANKSLSMYK